MTVQIESSRNHNGPGKNDMKGKTSLIFDSNSKSPAKKIVNRKNTEVLGQGFGGASQASGSPQQTVHKGSPSNLQKVMDMSDTLNRTI